MAAIETASRSQGPGTTRKPTQRRVRVVIRRVNPWSVLKFSLLFYFCLMLVMIVGLAILYAILSALGVLETTSDLLGEVGFGTDGRFEFNTGYIFRTLFFIGFISAALWSAFTLFLAFLYNLISDLVGGIEVTLTERH
jgi:hypothetical protein